MSIAMAEGWLKRVVAGQALHREDLGAENDSSGALRGISPATLRLAPQLQRELANELTNAPTPPQPKISAPSMGIGGNSGGGATLNRQNRSPRPPSDRGTNGDD